MENFIEGLGERYLERKIIAAPDQLERLAKKQFNGATGNGKAAQVYGGISHTSDGRDEEIERLRKKLAAAKLDDTSSTAASRPARSVHSSGAVTANEQTRRVHDPEDRDSRRRHEARPRSPSQGELNRRALQHADNGRMPLIASNLERLTSQQHILDKDTKHGGSAALLHASRAQHGRRETLAYSSLDAQGNPSTETFRPHRSSDLCLVEVVEEPSEHHPGRSKNVHHDTQQKQSDRRRKDAVPVRSHQEAIEIGHASGRKVYRIR